MTTLQAVIVGVMLAWVPSLMLVAGLLWREHRENARRARHRSKRTIAGQLDHFKASNGERSASRGAALTNEPRVRAVPFSSQDAR